MKKSMFLVMFVLQFAIAAPATINLSDEKQVIRGFGGMNHPMWVGDLTDAQRATVFGNGNNQLGFTVLRIPVPENQSDWSRVVATAKYAYERGFIVFASPWNPPSSMTETFTRGSQTNAKRLKASSYAAYATHLNDFVTYMKNQGAPLSAISIQNEPDYAQEWTWWTAAELVTFLKNNRSAIKCKVIAPESFQYTKSMSDPILNDATALANVDIIGAHLYGTQVSAFPYPLFKSKGAGKDLWMTEVYHPNSDADSGDKWPEALQTAQHVHNAMVEAEFQMYTWWYIRRSYSPLLENGNISKRGWMMAHFSKFVRPGYVRIDATKAPATNVDVSAYKSADSVVIVAINRNTSAVSQQFTISNGTVAKMSGKRTTGTSNMAAIDDVTLSNGSFTVSLPAQSVTTFVGARAGVVASSSSITPSSSSSAPASSSSVSSSSNSYSITCNVNNLEPSYVSGSEVPRPNVSCGTGVTVGTASFSAGSSITGWNSPGGTHALYNTGIRTVTLSNVECNGTVVTLNPVITCGSFEIVANTTPIANNSSLVTNHLPTYYSLKGEPLGNAKPQKAGVYIVREGHLVKKIIVR